jgi:hypothetical protein
VENNAECQAIGRNMSLKINEIAYRNNDRGSMNHIDGSFKNIRFNKFLLSC